GPDLDAGAVRLDEQADLLGEVVAEESRLGDAGGVAARPGDVPVGQARVDLGVARRLDADRRIGGADAAAQALVPEEGLEAVADEGGVLLVDHFEPLDGLVGIVEALRRNRPRALEVSPVQFHARRSRPNAPGNQAEPRVPERPRAASSRAIRPAASGSARKRSTQRSFSSVAWRRSFSRLSSGSLARGTPACAAIARTVSSRRSATSSYQSGR